MKALITAGGKGIRLRPITRITGQDGSYLAEEFLFHFPHDAENNEVELPELPLIITSLPAVSSNVNPFQARI